MRRFVALAAVVAAALAAPVVAVGGATVSTYTFTEQTQFWQEPDVCTGVTLTGTGTQTVTVTEVDTPNGGLHFRTELVGSVDLYQALGTHDDPQPGAYVGTWTYRGTGTDEGNPKFTGATDGTTHGVFTFADGSTAMRTSEFHITWAADGPKLFFAHFACGGQ
jgi:hypothetical protein